MTTTSRLRRAVYGALVASLSATTLIAQTAAPSQTSATASPSKGRLIATADLKAWNTVRQTALSADGKWFAYVVAPAEGNATVVVRGTARDAKETRIPVGENGGSIALSGDSKWIGYLVAPPRAAADSAGRGRAAGAGRGGVGGAGARADSAAPRPRANKFVVMNLATGEKKEFDRIRRFNFNADQATWVAMLGYPAGGGAAADAAPAGRGGGPPLGAGAENAGTGGGANLMLYNLASGELLNIGLVGEYAFNQSGEWLAYTMDTPDHVGNGVQLHNLKTNIIRSVDSDRQLYRHLAWADSSRALGVMRAKVNETTRDTAFSIAAFTDFGASGPAKKLIFDPAGREDFPSGWKIAFDRAPRFARGMTAVFFGIREIPRTPRPLVAGRGTSPIQAGAPGAGGSINQGRGGGPADSTTSLVLWHAKDPRLQSQQIVQEQADRSFNFLSEYRFADDRFVRLTTDSLRNVSITSGERYAYGIDTRNYEQVASYSGRNYQDVYRIDLTSGKSTLVMKKKPSIGGFLASPDGQKVLYWGKDGHFWVLDLATGDTVNITRSAPISFANREDDHNNIFPAPGRSLGWAKDGSAVLLSDGWDVWKVPAKPGTATNLTGDGRKNQIRYQRIYPFDTRTSPGTVIFIGGLGGGLGEGIDLSKPIYFATYGEWTKKEGLSRVDPGQPGAKRIFFDEARFNIIRARDAETYLYTRQNFTEFPNWWVFGEGFKDGYQITDVNPQMKDLAWSSGTRLIDYVSDKGDKLQGALYLPANYEPGKKYPLLVTIYEKRSQNMRGFVNPTETRAPDPTLYTNRGYAVLDPDIVYRVNDPGMSAVWCVVPAVKAAIATGIVDAKNVGLWGHSWGGYQTAFLVTQTNIFTAAIAGAPLTDLVSMYSSVYWNTGGTNQAIFEASQGRFKGNFIDNYDAYIRNSPAFQAKNVQTPLIILHNDKDGAVDFNQGITYFNTLRQLGKDVILLEYVGENHGLARAPNQKDYALRMSEWFDHHLKGAPVADWIANGVPRIRMDEHLQQRRDSTTRVVIP